MKQTKKDLLEHIAAQQKQINKLRSEIEDLKCIRNTIHAQLSTKDNVHIDMGRLSDKSGSWIEVSELYDPKKPKDIKSIYLSFNDEGTEINELSMFITPVKLVHQESKLIVRL